MLKRMQKISQLWFLKENLHVEFHFISNIWRWTIKHKS